MSIGITERTALKIIGELDADGYIERRRKGRRNVYRIYPDAPLRHHLGAHVPVGDLLAVIAQRRRRGAA